MSYPTSYLSPAKLVFASFGKSLFRALSREAKRVVTYDGGMLLAVYGGVPIDWSLTFMYVLACNEEMCSQEETAMTARHPERKIQSENQEDLARLLAQAMKNPALAAAMSAYGQLTPYMAYIARPTYQVRYSTGGNA